MGNAKKHDEGEGAWLISYADVMTLLVGFFVMLMSFSKIDMEKFESMKRETSKSLGGEYKQPQQKLVLNLQRVLAEANLQDKVEIKQTETLAELSFPGGLFFDTGSIHLRAEAKSLLNKLVPVVLEEARGHSVIIEGHTDSVPLRSGQDIATNWELSSLRACTVLRMFESLGFNRKNLQAIGWGDTRPVVPESSANPVSVESRQARNRRVVIKIVNDFQR